MSADGTGRGSAFEERAASVGVLLGGPLAVPARHDPWPRVWCGGPAEPVGPPGLVVEFPCLTVSETNERSSWAKIRRKKAQRDAVEEALTPLGVARQLAALCGRGPWCVRLTRIAKGSLLDLSNLPPALKAVEDAVAFALGASDGSAAWGCCWAQEKRPGEPGVVRVEVWGAGSLPVS